MRMRTTPTYHLQAAVLTLGCLASLPAGAGAGEAALIEARGVEAYDQGNAPLAVLLWRQAARAGSADAMTALGGMLEAGDGVRASARQALFWYARAARRGEPHAMVLLAEHHLSRDPVDDRGRTLLVRAAALGHLFAQRRLAELSGGPGTFSSDRNGDRP